MRSTLIAITFIAAGLLFLLHPIFEGAGMPPAGLYKEMPND